MNEPPPERLQIGDGKISGYLAIFLAVVPELPFVAQVLLTMLVADLFQYTAHRAFRAHPRPWRFHAVHHSVRTMDRLAGSSLRVSADRRME